MKIKDISTDNRLTEILNFAACKKLVAKAKKEGTNYAILCPHYSINIASKYRDTENEDMLMDDLDELSEYLGQYVSVSDYDDLVVDMTESTF